jgi:hypothetical protein
MTPSVHGHARDARLRANIPQSTPMCGVVERGVQAAVRIAFEEVYADLDCLT